MIYLKRKIEGVSLTSLRIALFNPLPRLRGQIALVMLFCTIVSILPSRRANNVGYVDPSMYIGYASNFSWLIESSGYEYHATRLPLIGLIKLLLFFGTSFFGILYKFFLMLVLIFSILALSRKFALNNFQFILAMLLIGLSPITQSAVSWTMPNGFAGIFATAVLAFGLISQNKTWQTFLLGALILNCFLLNGFGSIFVLISLAIVQLTINRRNFVDLFRWVLILSSGIAISCLAYQIIWNYFLRIRGSIWEPHLNVIFDPKTSEIYWRPVNSPTEQGLLSLTLIGVFLVFIILNRQNLLFQDLKLLSTSGVTMLVVAIVTYTLKLNFSFTSFWYFYIYIPLYAISAICITYLLRDKQSVYIFLLAGIFYVFILLGLFEKRVSLGNWTLVGGISLISLFLVKKIGSKFSKYHLQVLPQALTGLFGFLLLFQSTPLLIAYDAHNNFKAEKLIEDTVKYNQILASQTSTFGKVATWYEPDETGYRGSIISSSAFHLLRLEGTGSNAEFFEANSWKRNKRTQLECLVQITSVDWQPENFWKGNVSYREVSVEALPSKTAKVSVFCENDR